MNYAEKIQYSRELEKQKAKLERKLVPITRNIEEQKNSCLHISADLGYYGYFPSTGDKYRCLICGKGKNEEFFYEPKYIVHAENYLPQYDIKEEEQCNNKFDHIQTLALGLLKEKPDMSREELVDKINNLIQESITASSTKTYYEEMNKLVSLLNLIIKSDEYTMLVESTEDENMLEYGILGQEMKTFKFNNLNGESFWKFMYQGIYTIAPESVVNFMNINASGNIHSSVVIDLNDKVQAIITNRDHKYDEFISTLQDIMENSEDVSEKSNSQKGPVLSKKIKPLY